MCDAQTISICSHKTIIIIYESIFICQKSGRRNGHTTKPNVNGERMKKGGNDKNLIQITNHCSANGVKLCIRAKCIDDDADIRYQRQGCIDFIRFI